MRLFEIKNKKIIAFHGYSKGYSKNLTVPAHFAYDENLAKMYSKEEVGKFELSFKNPLIISDNETFHKYWSEANLTEPEDFAPMGDLKAFEKFASKKHDGIIFEKGMFDSSELMQNTFGDDLIIVLDNNVMTFLELV